MARPLATGSACLSSASSQQREALRRSISWKSSFLISRVLYKEDIRVADLTEYVPDPLHEVVKRDVLVDEYL
jgi:hypothetical protein